MYTRSYNHKRGIHKFDISKFFEFQTFDDGLPGSYDILNGSVIRTLNTIDYSVSTRVGTAEYGPDLVAYLNLTSEQLWWIVMLYNDLSCIHELKNDMNITLPSYEDLDQYYADMDKIKIVIA